jgi:hypothetical protein
MTSTLSQHTHTLDFKMNTTTNTLSSAHTMSATPLRNWGIDLSYEEHVSRHTPSGKWNHLVASIILDARAGRPLHRLSTETPYDGSVCRAQLAIDKSLEEEKRLLSMIKKTKEELKNFVLSSSDEEDNSADADSAEDEDEIPEPSGGGPSHSGLREKTGKDPRWLQSMKNKKEQQQQALKRKSLLSSLKTQTEALDEVHKTLADERALLLKQTMLQDLSLKLQKAIRGAESTYRSTLDQDFLAKNIHYNMELWTQRSAPLLPPIKMVPRLMGSPGAFKTVMVPEHEQPIIPLQEYLREDW